MARLMTPGPGSGRLNSPAISPVHALGFILDPQRNTNPCGASIHHQTVARFRYSSIRSRVKKPITCSKVLFIRPSVFYMSSNPILDHFRMALLLFLLGKKGRAVWNTREQLRPISCLFGTSLITAISGEASFLPTETPVGSTRLSRNGETQVTLARKIHQFRGPTWPGVPITLEPPAMTHTKLDVTSWHIWILFSVNAVASSYFWPIMRSKSVISPLQPRSFKSLSRIFMGLRCSECSRLASIE